MSIGRVPGPQGRSDFDYECVQRPGIMRGFSRALAEPVPPPVITNDDDNDLRAMQEVFGVLSAKGKAYLTRDKKKKWVRDTAAYAQDRDAYFGSLVDYLKFKKEAVDELDADGGKLRNLIEPPKAVRRKNKKDWQEAQNIFYSWVRKAYQKLHGDKVDVPKLIKSGTSEKLQAALNKVKVDSGQEFKSGGFNPRPMKLSGKYRLGTLSEHATGMAVDVESATNAQITTAQWTTILKFTEKALDHSARRAKWKSGPEDLHKAVKEVNDEFVTKLNEAIKAVETAEAAAKAKTDAEIAALVKAGKAAAAAALQAAASAKVSTKPIETAIANNEHLKSLGSSFVNTWKSGFLTLDAALVKEFREEGFTWGATFSDPDLHHFEL